MGWEICEASVAIVALDDHGDEGAQLARFFTERALDTVHLRAPPPAAALADVSRAIVVFTTGFGFDSLRDWLEQLLRQGRPSLVIAITDNLPAWSALAKDPESALLVLARPVVAWHLLDVIRQHTPSSAPRARRAR